jgi:hypothetical protein
LKAPLIPAQASNFGTICSSPSTKAFSAACCLQSSNLGIASVLWWG